MMRQESAVTVSILYRISFLCVVCPFQTVPAIQNYNAQPIISPGTFTEARDTCRNLKDGPWHLPSPAQSKSGSRLHRYLISHMDAAKQDNIWVSLKKERLRGWKNIDNTTYAGRVQENGDTRKTCALVKLRYEAAVSDFCESSGYGYICQMKKCISCPPDISPHNCIVLGKSCFILGCDAGSWYEASNRCVAMDTTLATLRSEEEVVRLVRKIKRRPNNPCQHFWVGLLKATWSFHDRQGVTTPQQYYWYTDHPVPGNNCATMKKFDVGYYWVSSDCEARHEFICVKKNGRGDGVLPTADGPSSQGIITEKVPLSSEKYVTYVGVPYADVSSTIQFSFYLTVLTLVMIFIIFAIIIGAALYWKYSNNRGNNTLYIRKDTEKDNEDLTRRLSRGADV